MTSTLLSPIDMGPLTLPNRIVMAPMTRCRVGRNGVPGEINATYYAQRASAGLIVSEACAVSPQAIGYINTPGIYNEEQENGWRKVTDAVHAKGGRIFLQLWHVGRISHPSLQPDGGLPVAPSAVKPEGKAFTYEGMIPFVTPRALSIEEISGIVEEFRAAATRALRSGFDGIEIHAANGYLIDQFLRDKTNRRDDAYGGPVENRLRFLMEVIDAVTGVWGPQRVGVRISPTNDYNDIADSDPESLFTALVDRLTPLGLAYLHVLEGGIQGMASPVSLDYDKLSEHYQGLYMANNGYDETKAESTLTKGAADLISFGIPFIANPDLPERFAGGFPLSDPDPDTFYMGKENGYIDYPALADS
jgi:N-ethylmaleimide reductase